MNHWLKNDKEDEDMELKTEYIVIHSPHVMGYTDKCPRPAPLLLVITHLSSLLLKQKIII